MPATHTLRLTDRDETILADLGEVTVLSFAVIRRRHFAADVTGKSCQRRLRYLTDAKLIVPVMITSCFGQASDRHTVYRLTQTGADLLAQKTGEVVRVLRTDPKPDTLLHRVLVARTMLAMTDGAVSAGKPRPLWLLEHDRWPDAPRDVPEPRQYRLAFDYMGVPVAAGRPIEQYAPPVYDDPAVTLVKARPDAACLLMLAGGTAPLSLFFEVDAGSETLGQVIRKLPGYHALLTRRSFDRPWRDLCDMVPTAARVLFVFTSEERMRNFLERVAADPTCLWTRIGAYSPSPADSQRAAAFLEASFRFTTLTALEQPGCLARPIWATLRRRNSLEKLAISQNGCIATVEV